MKYSLLYVLVQYTKVTYPFVTSHRAFTMLSNPIVDVASSLGVKRARTDEPIVNVERDHFAQFVTNRNWRFSEGFWSRLIHGSAHRLPDYVIGDTEGLVSRDRYGVTSLDEIHEAGKKGEFVSKNFRYSSKQTFALRVGYDGNKYHGYQMQKYCPGLTVELDLKEALGCNTIGAGRTDRGVSAVSQVICFNHNDMTRTPEYYLEKFRSSKPFLEGRLAVYDCQRVPKKFHARASATWRRYLYMFPLNRIDESAVELGELKGAYGPASDPESSAAKYDVDIEFLNRLLSKLENVDLPYNAYAFKLDRVAGNGMQDKCILYKARASVVNLADAVPGTTWGPVPTPIALDPSLVRVYKKEEKNEEKKEEESEAAEGDEPTTAATSVLPGMTADTLDNSANESTVAMDEVEPSLMAAVDKAPSPEHQQQQKKKTKNKSSDENDNDDEAEDAADSYFTSSSTSGANEAVRACGMDPTVSVEVPEGSEVPALCIELVGNRFLRRMVRILTATAIREATKDPSERNENLLVEICNSGDRERAARALPGPPLCLAGVGYDAFDLSLYKFQPKTEVNARIAERDRELAK